MDPHDPVARVIFRLLKDHLPAGVIFAEIEHCRSVTKEVPDDAIGNLACACAEKIAALSVSATPARS